jgi:hypothetical protein
MDFHSLFVLLLFGTLLPDADLSLSVSLSFSVSLSLVLSRSLSLALALASSFLLRSPAIPLLVQLFPSSIVFSCCVCLSVFSRISVHVVVFPWVFYVNTVSFVRDLNGSNIQQKSKDRK